MIILYTRVVIVGKDTFHIYARGERLVDTAARLQYPFRFCSSTPIIKTPVYTRAFIIIDVSLCYLYTVYTRKMVCYFFLPFLHMSQSYNTRKQYRFHSIYSYIYITCCGTVVVTIYIYISILFIVVRILYECISNILTFDERTFGKFNLIFTWNKKSKYRSIEITHSLKQILFIHYTYVL